MLRSTEIDLKFEALTGGVLQSAFKNFAKFTVKHLCWSLFLISCRLDGVQLYVEKKLWHRCSALSILFKKTYLVEHVRTDAWVKWTKKITFTKSIYGKTPAMASFLVQLQTCGLTVFQNGLHHRWFSMKIGKFHRTSILHNNAARLSLISCDIFYVSLSLSVINRFSHSMEI